MRSAPPRTSSPYRSIARADRARATRRRVLEAATAVFLERGYAAATIKEIAGRAAVSVPTVELLFRRKNRLLKEAIDVAIAGDDEPQPVLERPAVIAAGAVGTAGELLAAVAAVIAPAQQRSAGLVLAAFEGAAGDPELAELAGRLAERRATTAAWIVERLEAIGPRRASCPRARAVDTVWMLMDPAVFDRLTRHRHWSGEQYAAWFAESVQHLLLGDDPPGAPRSRPRRSA